MFTIVKNDGNIYLIKNGRVEFVVSNRIIFKIKEERRPEIELLLAKKGLSKMRFAQNIGLNLHYLYQILNGNRHCGATAVFKICTGLSVDVDDYFSCESVQNSKI